MQTVSLYNRAVAIAPSDTVDLAMLTDAIYVGGAGVVVAVMQDGSAISFAAAVAGFTLPIRIRRVNATGTTATNLVALNTI